jgi:hypothetical protein
VGLLFGEPDCGRVAPLALVEGTQEHTGGGPRVQRAVWPSGQPEPDDPAFRAKAALGVANIERERNVSPKSVVRVKDIAVGLRALSVTTQRRALGSF